MKFKHGMTVQDRVKRVAAHATTRANMARARGNMSVGAMQHSRARRANQHLATHGAGHHATGSGPIRVKAHNTRTSTGKVVHVHDYTRTRH